MLNFQDHIDIQECNQEIFRGGTVSCIKGPEKNLEVFLLDSLQAVF